MAVSGSFTVSASVQGRSYGVTTNINTNAALQVDEACVPGNSANLTTRTNTTDGTFTANNANHTIASNTTVDLYWPTGARRSVAVGTVSGTAIPVSGGQGDNLPALNTNGVVVSTVSEVSTSVVGANAKSITVDVAGIVDGQYSLLAGSTEVLGGRLNSGADYIWFLGSGVTNPITGNTITKVRFSQGGTANTNQTVRGSIQY